MESRKKFRNFQLKFMGWVSICIAPVTALFTVIVHRLPFPMSISETGTIANKVSPILPFALGALALFGLAYGIHLAHDTLDTWMAVSMAIGFTLVAAQPVTSAYTVQEGLGIFNLSHTMTDVFHYFGALVGFSAMIVWVSVCFTKSNKAPHFQTPEKRKRNVCYMLLAVVMLLSLLLFVANAGGKFGTEFPIIWLVEAIILCCAGVALLIKGGMFLKDKGEGI